MGRSNRAALKTIVYQSYRTTDVPPWVQTCLSSARGWSESRGFDYRFLDDRFFEYCPAWYRDKVGRHLLLLSDLARLVAARELHRECYDRAIWIDADVLVFAPAAFAVETAGESFVFTSELWVNRQQGRFVGWEQVNNAVCAFDRGCPFLDFYIDACERIVRRAIGTLDRLGVGTKFLTELAKLMPMPVIRNVGSFNPILMEHLVRGNLESLRAYRKSYANPIAAANLCGSFRNATVQGVLMSDAVYESAIEKLLGDAGAQIARP